jgi:hypothetical protein
MTTLSIQQTSLHTYQLSLLTITSDKEYSKHNGVVKIKVLERATSSGEFTD